MKILNNISLILLLAIGVSTNAQETDCDDFLDEATWESADFSEGDLLGYTQGGVYEINCTEGVGVVNSFGNNGISIGVGIVDFDFSGDYQTAQFTVYNGTMAFGGSFNVLVNGSLTYVNIEGAFPAEVDGVTIDLDESPADPEVGDDIWGEVSTLTFTGNISQISFDVMEGGILALCVEDAEAEEEEEVELTDCDDFLDEATWVSADFSEGDLLGYTQGGVYEINCTEGVGVVNSFGNNGISIGVGIVDFDFSGDYQTALFTVYNATMAFGGSFNVSVNGSVTYVNIEGTFPVVIDGVTIDLDESPADPEVGDDIWGEVSTLTFTGNISQISFDVMEGGILALCVEGAEAEEEEEVELTDCDDFLDEATWVSADFSEGDLLGYTQGGVYEINCTEGVGSVNGSGNNGISIGVGIVDFDFSGDYQTALFTVYNATMAFGGSFNVSVNGSVTYVNIEGTFPVVIDGVTIDLDESPADPEVGDDIWGEVSTLTFTGNISQISFDVMEGGILSLCAEDAEAEFAASAELSNSLSVYPNPFTNNVTVNFSESIGFIEIYNTTGQVVLSEIVGGSQVTLDLSNLNTGIYILKMTDSQGNQLLKKLVKE